MPNEPGDSWLSEKMNLSSALKIPKIQINPTVALKVSLKRYSLLETDTTLTRE